MKVVLSADGSDESRAARAWCARYLGPDDLVVAVEGISRFGEFVIGVPPFDSLGNEHALLVGLDRRCCVELRRAGVPAQARLVDRPQAHAVRYVAEREHADLVVVGKRPHRAFADAVLGEVAARLVHHPPCPVVVVPAEGHASADGAGDGVRGAAVRSPG